MTSALTLDHQHLISWVWAVQTSSSQFGLVSAHGNEKHHVGLASLQIQNSNNADMLLDVRKLCCESIEVGSYV